MLIPRQALVSTCFSTETRLKPQRSKPGINRVGRFHVVVPFLTALLCLTQGVTAIQSPTTTEEAHQKSATADDHASTLEGRQSALRQLQEAARLFLSAGETVEAARTLNRIGRLQLVLNDPKAALASHNNALNVLKQLSDR